MPELKQISGHSKRMIRAMEYFERDRGGNLRMLAWDGINIAHESAVDPSKTWAHIMDETRERFGNNERSKNGRDPRTYQHLIISLDPRDTDVTLDEFQEFVRGWAQEHFDGGLGRFQVAIIYHDDNMERIASGLDGVLHAHVVVNNTDLETGQRLAPKLTKRAVDELYASLNRGALERGWHGFTTKGESMTLAEMLRRGLRPSANRYQTLRDKDERYIEYVEDFDRYADGVAPAIDRRPDSARAPREEARAAAPSAPEAVSDSDPVVPAEREARPETPPGGVPGEASGGAESPLAALEFASGGRADILPGELPSAQAGALLEFASGPTYRIVPANKPTRPTRGERWQRERKGHSWKHDIRQRVRAASSMATSEREFVDMLSELDVEVTRKRDGEYKYTIDVPGAGKRSVMGTRLGKGFTAEDVSIEISSKALGRAQRASSSNRARPLPPSQRVRAVGYLAGAQPGTREGAELFERVTDLLLYSSIHAVDGPGDFPDNDDGRRMRDLAVRMGLFDGTSRALDMARELAGAAPERRVAIARWLREEGGEGGPEAGGGSDPSATGTQGGGAAAQVSREMERGR